MFAHRHLLGIEGLTRADIETILDLAERYVALNRQADKRADALKGLTQINMFFEASTRTQASFELAGKRLGANVMNMSVAASLVKKGETLIDTAMTLNAMHPDVLVVRHQDSGAVALLAHHVRCAVINAGDGAHEHPTQALLDALTIRRRKGRLTRPWGQQTQRGSVDEVAKSFDLDIDQPVVEAVQAVAEQRGLGMAQVAMAWLLSKPVVTAPIVGATKPHHLADAVAALDITLADEEIQHLEAPYQTQPAYWW